jgi:hypothetical protein
MDATLASLVRCAKADPDTLALVLGGSRSVGHQRPDSDYDVYVVRRVEADPAPVENVEWATITLEELRRVAPYWWTDGLVQGRILLDKTDGELERQISRLRAADDVERPYDAYLNAFVRGAASAKRGDELGARLHAADSVRYLAESFAALEGRRPRFHDRLTGNLGEWEPRLLELLCEPTIERQRTLRRDVQALMELRGFTAHRAWGTKLDEA